MHRSNGLSSILFSFFLFETSIENVRTEPLIEPQIKTVSILTDNSLKIVYPLPFQLSSLQTLASSKNYVSIFPSFISCLSGVGFLK